MSENAPTPATRPAHPAAYIRVARAGGTDDPRVRQQRHRVLSAAAELGWPDPEVYTDAGVSGRGRPGSALATLARHIRDGQHDAVITLDVARISRTASQATAFAGLCHEHGVTLHTLTHGLITSDALAVLGGIA